MPQAETRLRWSVLGVGTAGRARCRAIEGGTRSRLVAVHRGRHASDFDVPRVSLERAIARAQAVAVCSPSEHHADQVRQVLEAGRHALVEYPLASSEGEARDLFALAARVDRTLHVAHIELLGPAAATLRAHIRPEQLEAIRMGFTRSGPADADAAHLARTNLARIHRVIDLGGPIAELRDIRCTDGTLEALAILESGVEASLAFRQAPDLERNTHLEVDSVIETWTLDGGMLWRGKAPVTLFASSSLFSIDQRAAVARILDGTPPYVSTERVLHALRVVDRLASMTPGPIATAPGA